MGMAIKRLEHHPATALLLVGILVISQHCNDYSSILEHDPKPILDLDPTTLETSGMSMEECGRIRRSHMAEDTTIMKSVDSISRDNLNTP